jgi:transaldolase
VLLFLDTAELDAIERYAFIIDGVTTTPTIIKRAGLTSDDFMRTVRKRYPELEVHVEALAEDVDSTQNLIRAFCQSAWYDSDKVVFKVPISEEGLQATKEITYKDPQVRINLHMAFSSAQASLAMLAGPDYVAPLIGRYSDKIAHLTAHGHRDQKTDAGYSMLKEILECKTALGSDVKVLASSIRTVRDFSVAVSLGSDAVTLPPKVLADAFEHPMTHDGVEAFRRDLV